MNRLTDDARAALTRTRPLHLLTSEEIERRREVELLKALERGLADRALRRSIAGELLLGDHTEAELDAQVAAVSGSL